MNTPRRVFLEILAGMLFLSGISAQSNEQGNSGALQAEPRPSLNNEVNTMDSLYHFKAGDRIIFKRNWNPGYPREDPHYISPVPEGTLGTVLDTAEKYIRVRLDDADEWPRPVLLWKDGLYDDEVEGGLSCIGKLIVN